MRLNEISDKPEARRARKRLGRGIGSGTGKTAGRGHKGQKSRSGVSLLGFEGGQMPLHRRMPKAGFTNIFRKNFRVVNLGRLQQAVDAGKLDAAKPVTEAALAEAGVIKSIRDGVRVLAKGLLNTKLALQVTGASRAAVEAIEGAGGSIEVTPRKEKHPKRKEKHAKRTKMGEVEIEETSDADGAGDATSDKE